MSSLPPTPNDDASPIAPVSLPYAERRRDDPDARVASPFLPILLLVLAGVAWPSFQCYQLMNEKQALATVHGNQTKPFDDSGKLRNALDGIARDTAALASNGNAGAKLIVDELARRGITINPNAPPLAAPPQADKK